MVNWIRVFHTFPKVQSKYYYPELLLIRQQMRFRVPRLPRLYVTGICVGINISTGCLARGYPCFKLMRFQSHTIPPSSYRNEKEKRKWGREKEMSIRFAWEMWPYFMAHLFLVLLDTIKYLISAPNVYSRGRDRFLLSLRISFIAFLPSPWLWFVDHKERTLKSLPSHYSAEFEFKFFN